MVEAQINTRRLLRLRFCDSPPLEPSSIADKNDSSLFSQSQRTVFIFFSPESNNQRSYWGSGGQNREGHQIKKEKNKDIQFARRRRNHSAKNFWID
jgi:hypothetical protein